MINWQDHENLMLAAGLARRAARPQAPQPDRGFAAAQLLSREGDRGQDVDPLEARLVDQILADRERRQFESQRQADEAQKWERALQMQARQETRDDRIRGEERAARREDVAGERGFTREQTQSQQAFAREQAATGHGYQEKDYDRSRKDRMEDWHRQQLGAVESQVAALQYAGDEIPPQLLGQLRFHREALGLKDDGLSDSGGQSPEGSTAGGDRLTNRERTLLQDRALGEGDFETARAIRQAGTPAEVRSLPGEQVRRNVAADPLIEKAAKMLDEGGPGIWSSLFFGSKRKPWQEKGGMLERGTYFEEADIDPLQRAQALQEAMPEFRQFGITPEEIVDRYKGRGRFQALNPVD